MTKCEDVLMSSDLFTNDALFSELTDHGLNATVDPFDFLNTTDSLQNNNPQTEKVEKMFEDPVVAFHDSTPPSVSKTNEVLVKNQSTNDATPVARPKVTAIAKDTSVKVTPHQVRNIQPKPDTSSYRIVAVTDVNNVSKSQSPQTVKVHANGPNAMEKSRNTVETVVKKVVPVTDLRLVNSGIEKQVRARIHIQSIWMMPYLITAAFSFLFHRPERLQPWSIPPARLEIICRRRFRSC